MPAIRVALVLDTQPNGAQETGPNIFPDMGSAGQDLYSFQQMAGGMPGRFQILGTKLLRPQAGMAFNDAAATGSVTLPPMNFEFTKQWKRGLKMMIKSNSGTPAIANLTDTNIFLVAHSAATAITTSILGCCRAYYVD